jgi:hypothetical protein
MIDGSASMTTAARWDTSLRSSQPAVNAATGTAGGATAHRPGSTSGAFATAEQAMVAVDEAAP